MKMNQKYVKTLSGDNDCSLYLIKTIIKYLIHTNYPNLAVHIMNLNCLKGSLI